MPEYVVENGNIYKKQGGSISTNPTNPESLKRDELLFLLHGRVFSGDSDTLRNKVGSILVDSLNNQTSQGFDVAMKKLYKIYGGIDFQHEKEHITAVTSICEQVKELQISLVAGREYKSPEPNKSNSGHFCAIS